MLSVVADTGPLHYLVLVGQVDLLPRLFTTVLTPATIQAELSHAEAPAAVRQWATYPPSWIAVHQDPPSTPSTALARERLDDGERAVLALAEAVRADLILMDDRQAVKVARRLGFAVTGTLGVLDRAAQRNWIDLPEVVALLKATNFRCRPAVMDALLNRSGP